MPTRMTRRVAFSSGHRYWNPALTTADNSALYGKWASPFNHGHNYILDVTVSGAVDPLTGMVVNIKRLDDLLRDVIVSQLDGKSINDEIAAFAAMPPTVENLLRYVRDQLVDRPDALLSVATRESGEGMAAVRLVKLRLEETPRFWGELDLSTDTMTLTRSYEFAASHRLYSTGLSHEDNLAIFGKCANVAGHGHNYVLEVTVAGTPDEQTGMIVDLGRLDEAVHQLVLDRYDHRNLDVDVPELCGKITTSEVVAETIFQRLDGKLPARLDRVRLLETSRNAFEVTR